MKTEVEILKKYVQADFSKRMYLFLQFPGLRDAFQEIERKDLAAQRDSYVRLNSIQKKNVLASIVSRLNYRGKEIKRIGVDG